MTLGSLVVQDLTYTCRQLGDAVVLNYLNSDSLSVSVSGHTINVNIVSGITTAAQIKTALDADLDVMYLVSVAVSGTGSNAQVTCKNALIANGVTTAVAASQIIGTLKYTAQTAGVAGNNTRVKYIAGSLSVAVATNDITISIVDGVTTASAIKAAVAASGPANALVSVVSSGAALTVPQHLSSALSFTNLVGGLDPIPGSVVVQDLTYSTDANTDAYNGKSITYTTGATAGAEVVTVSGSDNVSIQIENGVSTATQIKAACDASVPFNGTPGTPEVKAHAQIRVLDWTNITGAINNIGEAYIQEGTHYTASTSNDDTAILIRDAYNIEIAAYAPGDQILASIDPINTNYVNFTYVGQIGAAGNGPGTSPNRYIDTDNVTYLPVYGGNTNHGSSFFYGGVNPVAGSDKYQCTITGTGSNAQKTVNALQTTGAVGQGANAVYKDQAITALTSSYVFVNFHFHANNLTLINDETSGNKTIDISWDGINLHGSLLPGQSLGWNLQTTVTGIWLKYVNAAPNYRLYVLGA